MNPHLKTCVGLAVLGVALVFFCVPGFQYLNRYFTPTNRTVFDRLKIEMTEAEVEVVIGIPPGWYAGNRHVIDDPLRLFVPGEGPIGPSPFSPTGCGSERDGFVLKAWATPRGAFYVYFDKDGLVSDLLFREVR
jgi:hypothetical protein